MGSLLRNRGFWLLLSGQSISALGDILYTVAVLSFTYAQTESVLGTASLMILTTLTRLVAGFVTVQVVDRLPHRSLMMSADLVRGLAAGLLGLASFRWTLGLPAIYAVTFVAAFAGSFFSPARASILPQIVAREELVRANGVTAAVAANWLSRKGGWMIAFSSASFALLTLWYAFCGNAVVAVVLCVAFGPVYQVRDVVQSSMLQASLDPKVIGRAFATREMLLMSLFGPAMAAMSFVADAAGPHVAYLLGAGLYAVVAVFSALSVPIRTYRMATSAS